MTRTELTIIVPVYNEAATVASIMDAVVETCPDAQVIYVDDGSKDSSLAILQSKARPQDLVLTKPNGGKGSAITMGLEHAEGTYTVIQDADLEYHPKQIPLLLNEAKRLDGSVIFGSRFLTSNPTSHWRFLLGNKVLTSILNVLYWSRITDSYTCYKLLPTDKFRGLKLVSRGFELEAEITCKCLRKGMKIHEIPIVYSPRTTEQGKKINWKDAIRGVTMMLKVRLGLQ
jgi:glycosyltransferase involved in cell wall biosynthesis